MQREGFNEDAPGALHQGRRRKVVLGAAAAGLVVVAGGVGALAWNAHLNDQAAAAFTEAHGRAVTVCTVEAVDAELLDAGQGLEDGALVAGVEKAVGVISPVGAAQMPQGRQARLDEAAKFNVLADECAKAADEVDEATTALENAVIADAKAKLEDARAQASASVEAGQAVVNDSAGKVSDDQVRYAVQDLITALNEQVGVDVDGADWKAMRQASAQLVEAKGEVDAAVQAVRDAQAAWQQAADAATQTAASAAGGSSSGSSGYVGGFTGYTSGSTSGGGYTGSSGASGGYTGGGTGSTPPSSIQMYDGTTHYRIESDAAGSYTDDLGEF